LHFFKQVTLSRAIFKGSLLKISDNLAQGMERYSLFSKGYPFFPQNLEILKKWTFGPTGTPGTFLEISFFPKSLKTS
jgi:hypothetical protein